MKQPQTPSKNIFLSFVGPTIYPPTKILRNACCQAVSSGATQLTLLISSSGGSTLEAFALYNFLRALPCEIITYNIGTIQSVANVVFLAGAKRLASIYSRFMFHDLAWSYGNQETLDRRQMEERTQSIDWDADTFVQIMTSQTPMTKEEIVSLHLFDRPTIIDPLYAQTLGIVHEVADAKIPVGAALYNVDY